MEMLAALQPGAAEIIIGIVAHALRSEVDAERLIISGELPIGGHRFELVGRSGMALRICLSQANMGFTLRVTLAGPIFQVST
jgi:Flp pilus assembly CpaF family ATPase